MFELPRGLTNGLVILVLRWSSFGDHIDFRHWAIGGEKFLIVIRAMVDRFVLQSVSLVQNFILHDQLIFSVISFFINFTNGSCACQTVFSVIDVTVILFSTDKLLGFHLYFLVSAVTIFIADFRNILKFLRQLSCLQRLTRESYSQWRFSILR